MWLVISCVVAVLLGACLGYVLKDAVQITATAVIGAFVACYSAGILLGGFPDFKELYDSVYLKH